MHRSDAYLRGQTLTTPSVFKLQCLANWSETPWSSRKKGRPARYTAKDSSAIHNRAGRCTWTCLRHLHLLEGDRLEVFADGDKIDFADLMRRAAAMHNDLETRFIVYRDLRQRGYVVKTDSGDFNFRLYPRGGTPTTTQTNLWVLAVSERYIFNIVELMRQAEMSERTRKDLLLAVVDEEGDITYYTAENADPKGELNDTAMKEVPEGLLMEGSILVLDEPHGTKLYQYGFYGKKIGKMLQLSFIETAYLIEHGTSVAAGGRHREEDGGTHVPETGQGDPAGLRHAPARLFGPQEPKARGQDRIQVRHAFPGLQRRSIQPPFGIPGTRRAR